MKGRELEEKFLDYLEGILPESESNEMQKALSSDDSLRRSFESYKKIVFVEKFLANSLSTVSPSFSVKVMDAIEESKIGFFRRLYMDLVSKRKGAYTALATFVTIILIFKGVQNIPYDQKEVNVAPFETKKESAKVESSREVAIIKSLGRRDAEVFDKILEGNSGSSDSAPALVSKGKVAQPLSEAVTTYNDLSKRGIEADNKSDISINHDTNSEKYAEFTENKRFRALQEPSSTFSIDVDTASYTNARRYLKDGILPPKDSIRIEEFLNYFKYNYPVQYETPFSLSYEMAPSPLESDRYLLKLGIKAKDIKETRKAWNIVFLVDVSGSMMEQNKLPLVQRSLKIMLESMKEGDTFSIVTYAGNAGVVLPPSTIKDRQKIINSIDSLSAGGSTNGSGGIAVAYQLAETNSIKGGINRVVLATDGDFNVGLTSREELIKLIEDKRKNGVTLTALGFGRGNLKDETMELLANKGNGNYFYIDSFQEARKVLESDLLGTVEIVAKDVKLQIEFNPENISHYRLIGYENRKLNREDFNNDKIDAGEIGSGHTVTALYEIILNDSDLSKKIVDQLRYQNKETSQKSEVRGDFNTELAYLKIRYKDPEGSESMLLQYPIESKDIKRKIEEASSDFKFAAAVSYFAHYLKGSEFLGSYSLKEIRALAESAKAEDSNGYRQEFIEMIKNAELVVSK